MKYAVLFAATAALALTACGKSETPEAPAASEAASEAATEAAAPAASEAAAAPAGAAAFTAGEAPSKEFMIGKWGQDGDCTLAIGFNADGTTDGPFGNWNLDAGVLTMADAPQKVHIKVVDANKMESRLDGKGEPKMMTRCP